MKAAFALPTVLLSSIVMMMILVTAISVTGAITSGLRDQSYNELASQAAEAGTVMATACLNQTGGQATWTSAKPLRPNTDCNGNIVSGQSAYVLERDDVRTYFSVSQPIIGAGNVPVSAASKGYSEVLKSSSGVVWRVWSSDTAIALTTANDGLPVGSSIEGYWTTAPAGYLLEDGSAVSRATYANLFAVIGTTYGAGNGSTTFNLPDSRGRNSIAKNSSDTSFDVVGEKGGEKNHTLTVAEIPSHSHWISSAAVDDRNFTGTGGNTQQFGLVSDAAAYSSTDPMSAAGRYSGNTGSGGSHNVLDPYIVVNRAIKY